MQQHAYEYIEDYENLSPRARKRLLKDVRLLGDACARDAYVEGLRVPYNTTTALPSDRRWLRALLDRYGVHELPYEDANVRHPIWQAFWDGAANVPIPKD
jgi:hypothetical protein